MLHGPRCLPLLPLQAAASRIFRREDASCRLQRHRRSRERNGEIPREPHCLPQQCLIFSAAFNEPFAEPLGAMRVQFYLDWMIPFSAGKADIIRRRLFEALKICYARFPVCRKRGPRGCSLLVVRSRAADPSFGRRFTARRSQNQGTGPWTNSWSRCWPPCWGAQGS